MSSEFEAATALRAIALDEDAKSYVLNHPPLYQVLRKAAMRFIGGETLAQCVDVARDLNRQGHKVTIDFMGESTRDVATAKAATQEFSAVIDTIKTEDIDASVSLDLSHIGMVIDSDLCYQHACQLAQQSQQTGLEMMISMEGTDRTDLVLDIYQRLCKQYNNVGITLQAYLYRTDEDMEVALACPGKVRLVKGAFAAPKALARSRGSELDSVYQQLMEKLLLSGHPCSIATHDLALLDKADEIIGSQQHLADTAEFEMLKGVTPERLATMRSHGYSTRVYLPYGEEWYLYLCNRLAEHLPNIYRAIVDATSSQHG
ncbi:MAG: proline dehydrogenase family protein [Cyanobacteria bacterium J06621_11]